jgi:hypothetical protein
MEMTMPGYSHDDDFVDYEDFENNYEEYADEEVRRSKLPYSHLTENDMEEFLALDLDLAEGFSWIWRRAIDNMCQEFTKEMKAAEAARLVPPSPHESYHDWWKSEQETKSKNRKARRDAARHAAKQEAKRAEQETEEYKALDAIKREGALRLKLLRASTKKPRGDKRVEQLRGQEELYVSIWKTAQVACLKSGPEVSAAKIAQIYIEQHPGEAVTRHQIRAWSKVIRELEQPGGIWAPDHLIVRLEKGKAALSK